MPNASKERMVPELMFSFKHGELMPNASKERMVPELMFSFKHVPQPSITDSKSEVAITLHFQLCYTVLQMKKSRKNTSAINPVTMKNADKLHRNYQLLKWPKK